MQSRIVNATNIMRGNQTIRFSELFADTVLTHGIAWAAKHCAKRGMASWEFMHWLRSTGVAKVAA